MNNINTLIITTISGLSTILGNLLILIPLKYKKKVLSFSLGLSFSVMFLISILELVPESLILVKNNNIGITLLSSLIYLYIGLKIVQKTEKKINKKDEIYKIGILNMISLLIHNIPEGIICAITSINNINLGLKLTFIIMLHNIPEGISIALPIYYATNNKKKALLYTTISGLGEVIGAILTIAILKYIITNYILHIILLITSGIMIYLSINKILKTGIKLNNKIPLLIGIIIGGVVVLITI